jgi:hypothetical protein
MRIIAYAHIGPARKMLLADYLFLTSDHTIGLAILDRIEHRQILVGWEEASLERFALDADWARRAYEELLRWYRGGQAWLM